MALDKVRFSDVMKDFNAELLKLPDGERGAMRDALAKFVAGKTFDANAKTADRADLSAVLETLPRDLKIEGKQMLRAFERECAYRGDNWVIRSAALTLVEGLTALAPTETDNDREITRVRDLRRPATAAEAEAEARRLEDHGIARRPATAAEAEANRLDDARGRDPRRPATAAEAEANRLEDHELTGLEVRATDPRYGFGSDDAAATRARVEAKSKAEAKQK